MTGGQRGVGLLDCLLEDGGVDVLRLGVEDVAGLHGVATNAVPAVVERDRTGEGVHGALAGGVGSQAGRGSFGGTRRDVDDRSPPLLEHLWNRLLHSVFLPGIRVKPKQEWVEYINQFGRVDHLWIARDSGYISVVRIPGKTRIARHKWRGVTQTRIAMGTSGPSLR